MRQDSDIQHRMFRETGAVVANMGVAPVARTLTLATAVADATHVDAGYGLATPVGHASVLGDKISTFKGVEHHGVQGGRTGGAGGDLREGYILQDGAFAGANIPK